MVAFWAPTLPEKPLGRWWPLQGAYVGSGMLRAHEPMRARPLFQEQPLPLEDRDYT